jgi:hypothetical protein
VFDRGIVSEENLAAIRKRDGQYLVGTPRSQMKQFEAELLKEDFTRVRPEVEVKKVAIPQGEETYILCRTSGRKEKEKAIRKRFSTRMEDALQGLERLARGSRRTGPWTAPKSAVPGDEVVIYIRGLGFFATARVKSQAEPRTGWKNRYGASLDSISLIRPPVSLAAIRRRIPDLGWAKYPRSITTPPPEIADQIRALISGRRKGEIDLDDTFLAEANIDELRKVALLKAHGSLPPKNRAAIYRAKAPAIRRYVLIRANGRCEGCSAAAPFLGADGKPFLETHHTTRVADDGPDDPRTVIGICPNCHRRAHYAENAKSFNASLIRKLPKLEAAARKR